MRESVNTIIQNDEGKYLLQMRDGTEGICNPLRWNFFGGGIKGINLLEEFARELKEELGVVVNIYELNLVGDVVDENGNKVHLAKCKKNLNWNDITVLEGAGAGFFTKDEILKINITPTTKQITEKYL